MTVLVAAGDRYCGSISIEDQIRESAKAAVKALEAMKVRVILLTGDSQAAASAVADQLGIFHVHSDLLPEQKAVEVEVHTKSGRTVAMLGDGINDAPALSKATVGIAMGAGTDVARECADVVLIGNDLEKFVETVRIARRCRAIIFQNFYGTLTVDAIGIGLAAVGLLNPLLAAFIHVASELAFILNSTRLLAPRQRVSKSRRSIQDFGVDGRTQEGTEASKSGGNFHHKAILKFVARNLAKHLALPYGGMVKESCKEFILYRRTMSFESAQEPPSTGSSFLCCD
jgi:soluble P-type ATPase